MSNELLEAVTYITEKNIFIKWCQNSYIYSYIDGYSCGHVEPYDNNTNSKLEAIVKTAKNWRTCLDKNKL